MSSEELNDQIMSDQSKGAVYLKTDDKQGQLQDKDIGEITFILNELKDVIYLPQAAVHKGNDKMYVFVEDEGGFKSMKEVETGLSLDRKVEIKSGLSEGDIVILD
jgi:HlyD family secretion protein